MATYSMTSALNAAGSMTINAASGAILAPGQSLSITGTLRNISGSAVKRVRLIYQAEYRMGSSNYYFYTYDGDTDHDEYTLRIGDIEAACNIANNASGSFSLTIAHSDTWRTRFRNYARYPNWYDSYYSHSVGSIDLTDETAPPLRIRILGIWTVDGSNGTLDPFLINQSEPSLLLQVCDSAAPVIDAIDPEDAAEADALEIFGGFAMNHSVPRMPAAFTLDSCYPALTASHTLTLTGALSATLTASTAAGVMEKLFELPALTAAGTVSWSYTVTDSYGGTATATGSFEVLSYASPAFSSLTAERYAVVLDQGASTHVAADYGTYLWLSYSAEAAAVTGPDGAHNPWTLTVEWAPDIGSGGGTLQLDSDTDGRASSASRSEAVSSELSASNGWVIRLTLADALESVSVETLLQPGHALLDIEPYGVAVGMHSTATVSDAGKFEVAEDWKVCGVFPVGAIYLSVDPTNPAAYFGGTWVSFGAGRVLVGVDANDTAFDTVEETGGEKTHQLVAGELPKISGYAESIMTDGDYLAVKATSPFSWTAGQRTRDYAGEGGSGLRRLNFNIGSNTPHNNLQPYITCYMWKRTA